MDVNLLRARLADGFPSAELSEERAALDAIARFRTSGNGTSSSRARGRR